MFQLLRDPKFDFMARRNLLLALSAIVVAAATITLAVRGLNLGIEFTGGAEVQIKYREAPDIGAIRSSLQAAGMTSQVVTTIGDPSEHEIYIRLGLTGNESSKDLTQQVVDSLRTVPPGGRVDLNVADEATLARLLGNAPGLAASEADSLAAAISEQRTEIAIFHDFDELAAIDGMSPMALDYLKQSGELGAISVRSQNFIGPAIGQELLNKATWAIVGSLIGMLIYIWVRFQLQWGLAAVVALAHDTLLTLGIFSLLQKEVTLPVVAAFLTLVGYSVNDTVVVFDRIRENLGRRRAEPLTATINASINQTLSRTIITSGLTFVVVFGLLLFGGAALNPFALVLTVGVLVGTYSSIYVASPFLVLWKQLFGRDKRGVEAQAASSTPAR